MVFFTSGFKIKSMETDVNGNFHGGNAYTNGQYHIQWGDYHFDIRKGRYTTALLWGPYRGGEWNLQITNAADKTYAHVHQAAIDYYYKCKDLFDIRRPWTNATFKPQLKIAVVGWSGYLYETHHVTPYVDAFGAFGLPDVFIYTKGGSSYHKTDVLYRTTIHELAHIAHWTMDPIGFSTYVTGAGASRRMCESWPEGVSYSFVNSRYRNNGFSYNKQGTEIDDSPCYTSIVEDLWDSCNQRYPSCGTGSRTTTVNDFFPDDDVSGYSLKDVEDALIGARSWNEWKDNLKEMYPNNPTKVHLDKLFNSWDGNDCKSVFEDDLLK